VDQLVLLGGQIVLGALGDSAVPGELGEGLAFVATSSAATRQNAVG